MWLKALLCVASFADAEAHAECRLSLSARTRSLIKLSICPAPNKRGTQDRKCSVVSWRTRSVLGEETERGVFLGERGLRLDIQRQGEQDRSFVDGGVVSKGSGAGTGHLDRASGWGGPVCAAPATVVKAEPPWASPGPASQSC